MPHAIAPTDNLEGIQALGFASHDEWPQHAATLSRSKALARSQLSVIGMALPPSLVDVSTAAQLLAWGIQPGDVLVANSGGRQIRQCVKAMSESHAEFALSDRASSSDSWSHEIEAGELALGGHAWFAVRFTAMAKAEHIEQMVDSLLAIPHGVRTH